MEFEQPPLPAQEEVVKLESEKEILSEIFQEIKKEIDEGKCGHSVRTKVKIGETFKGYYGEKGHDSQIFLDAPNMPEEVKNN